MQPQAMDHSEWSRTMSKAIASRRTTQVGETDADRAITCKVFRHGKPEKGPKDLGQISEILRDEGSLVWLDVVDPQPRDLEVLQEEFDLHPLAVEDAVEAHQRPKIEAYDHYWFVVVHGASMTLDGLELHEIAIFTGTQFLVTVRHSPLYPLEEIERRWEAHPERLRRGGGFLLYTILDTVVDGYFPVVDGFQERVDSLQEDLFANRSIRPNLLPMIFDMKKDAQRFRRSAMPLRDILTPMIRGDLKLIPADEIAYYRDVYDHAIRVIDQLDTVRDLATSALEIHLSVVANRHNEVAKQLTIIATIFLPLTFLTGFFGQNFTFLTAHVLTSSPAFWILGVGLEVFTFAVTIGYFKWKGWF
jgi:magnesium transporter